MPRPAARPASGPIQLRLGGVATGATTIDGTVSSNVRYGATLNLNNNSTWTAGNGAIGIYSNGEGPTSINIAGGTTFTDADNVWGSGTTASRNTPTRRG